MENWQSEGTTLNEILFATG